MNPCEYENQLTAWILGDLPETEAAALHAHLESCAQCRVAADELRITLALLEDALATPAKNLAAEPKLDAARRSMLLDTQPEVQPLKTQTHWFFRIHPAFKAAAALVAVLSIVILGAMSTLRGISSAVKPRSKMVANRFAALGEIDGVASDMPAASRRDARHVESGILGGRSAILPQSGASGLAHSDTAVGWESTSAMRSRENAANKPASAPEPAREVAAPEEQKELWFDRQSVQPLQRSYVKDSLSAANKASPAQDEAMEPQPMVDLKIALPKPQFTGTPKDLGELRSSRDERKKSEKADALGLGDADGDQLKRKLAAGDKSANLYCFDIGAGNAEVKSIEGIQLGRDVSGETVTSRRGGEAEERKRRLTVAADAEVMEEEVSAPVDVPDAGGVATVAGTVIVNEMDGKKIAADKDLDAVVLEDAARKPAQPLVPLPFNPFVKTAENNFSTFAIDVDTASYTLTRQAIQAGSAPDPERVRTEEIVNAFDYGDQAPESTVFRVYQDGAQSPFGPGLNMLRIGVKGRRLGREEQRPAMLTFVIDTSGSMAQPDRIGLARLALTLLMDQLSDQDRIQLIAYSDHATLILEPVSVSEKERVLAAFKRLQCNGSTNLEEGLQLAYAQAVQSFVPGAENRVILISDGVANLGAGSAQEILDKVAANRRQGITCSVFGVGRGTYNDRMLEQLANQGDGVYRFLDSEQEVKRAFVDDLAATLNTIAKDAKIQVEWNPEAVRRYRQLGYENRALAKEQFRDDSVDAGEVGSGQSVTALYELELAPDVSQETRLGTVRVRYQRTDSGKIEEIETALSAAALLRPAHQATPSFRVAASAAEFAEQLRGSPYAAGTELQAVADYLRPAVLELPLDTRVRELLDLITAMEAMQ